MGSIRQYKYSGKICTADIEKEIRPHTKLISIMFVNNEIGTINPINEISEMSHSKNIIFHTDAVQYIGKEAINLKETKIDFKLIDKHESFSTIKKKDNYISKNFNFYNSKINTITKSNLLWFKNKINKKSI